MGGILRLDPGLAFQSFDLLGNADADQGGELAALEEARDEAVAKNAVEAVGGQVLDALEAHDFLLRRRRRL